MTKASRIELIYSDIKQVMLNLPMRPGQRIDVDALAKHYGVSNVPIRMLMNRLVGEGVLEVIPHEGYALPQATAQRMRDLHQWNLNVLLLALEEVFDTDTSNALPPLASTGTEDVVLATEDVFSAIADLSVNREAGRTVRNMSDRLRRVRRLDLSPDIDTRAEVQDLRSAWTNGNLFDLHKLVWQYHYRRLQMVPQILALVYADPLPPPRPS